MHFVHVCTAQPVGKIRKDIMFKWFPNKAQYFLYNRQNSMMNSTENKQKVVPNQMSDRIDNMSARLHGQSQPDF